jgi:RNA binding exosome subunit
MEQILSLVEAGTEISQLSSPKEAATLIFAIERRLRATEHLRSTLYNTLGELLNKAGHLGNKASFLVVPQKLKKDILDFLSQLEDHEQIDSSDRRALTPALILLRQSLTLDQQPEF